MCFYRPLASLWWAAELHSAGLWLGCLPLLGRPDCLCADKLRQHHQHHHHHQCRDRHVCTGKPCSRMLARHCSLSLFLPKRQSLTAQSQDAAQALLGAKACAPLALIHGMNAVPRAVLPAPAATATLSSASPASIAGEHQKAAACKPHTCLAVFLQRCSPAVIN